MELSIFVAKIISLAYLSAGVGILSGQLNLSKMIKDFEGSPGLTYVAGIFTLVMGMLLVKHHNIWVHNWRVLITIVGWIALFKGMMLMAFPRTISRFKSWYKNAQGWGIFIIVVGLLFGYFGFFI
jgi:hypothetical protein